jgi:hypothetical protein
MDNKVSVTSRIIQCTSSLFQLLIGCFRARRLTINSRDKRFCAYFAEHLVINSVEEDRTSPVVTLDTPEKRNKLSQPARGNH